MKRKTTRARHVTGKRLELRVISPRICWLQSLKALGKLVKFVLLLALLGAAAWGASIGIRRVFLENEDFRLRAIELNANHVLDEHRLVEIGGINLNGSVFAVDVDALRTKLAALPELADADVERKLPATLVVRVTERVPVAWIDCPAHGVPARDPERGLLLDTHHVLFPCVNGLGERAAHLPVIAIKCPEPLAPTAGQVFTTAELDRCLRLLEKAAPVAAAGGWTIDRIEQANEWSLLLRTGEGQLATFGLGEHERQLKDFNAAIAHADTRGYQIETINLIPRRNIPITIPHDTAAPPPSVEDAPRAIPVEDAPRAIPVSRAPTKPTPAAQPVTTNRKERDLRSLLNRN